MTPAPPKRRRTFLYILLTLLVITLGATAYLFRITVRNWFDKEREDVAAIQKLEKADLKTNSANTTDWPQWRGPNRDGNAPSSPLSLDWETNPPSTKWKVACGGGYSSFALVGDTLFTMDKQGDNERVLALDPSNGNTRWTQETAVDYSPLKLGFTAGPRATPTVFEGKVYTFGAVGHLTCIDVKSGKPDWQKDLKAELNADLPSWGLASSPLIVNDLVIVQPGGSKGAVAAFERSSGTLKWTSDPGPAGYSSPVLVNLENTSTVVAVTGDKVLGLNPADGKTLWKYDWVTEYKGNIATPIVAGNYVFVSSNYAKGCALLEIAKTGDGWNAKEVYFRKNRVMRNHHCTSVLKDGFVYGSDNERLVCVDLRKGQPVPDWDGSDAGIGKGTCILAGKHLIVLTENGNLYLVEANPKECNVKGKFLNVLTNKEAWALPVLVNGHLYLRDHEQIKCLKVN